MASAIDAARIREGADVYGSDGGRVGSVVQVLPDHLVVEKGFFVPTDYYVPAAAVASCDGGKVDLNVTKEEALDRGWDAEPTDYAAVTGATTSEIGATTTTARTTGADDAEITVALPPDTGDTPTW
jgi:hypothetical protein